MRPEPDGLKPGALNSEIPIRPLKTPRLETVRATASAETLAAARKDLSLPGCTRGSVKKMVVVTCCRSC